MPLPSSGAISLNEMHVEVGGSSGTQASINDADIRGLISKSSGSQMAFNEWYGASSQVLNFQFAYYDGQSNQNNHYMQQPKTFPSQNGDKAAEAHIPTISGARGQINGATWDIDAHMALTPTASNLYGFNSTAYGYRLTPTFSGRYTSSGGITYLTDFIPNRNYTSYGGKGIAFYRWLGNYYDWHSGVCQYEVNTEGTSTTIGTVDWNYTLKLGSGSPYMYSQYSSGGVCSDNGTPINVALVAESNHPNFGNTMCTKFDPSGSSSPYVHAFSPQNITYYVSKKPVLNGNNEIVMGGVVYNDTTYNGGFWVGVASGTNWNSSSNGMTFQGGRIINTGQPIYSTGTSNNGSLDSAGPNFACDSSNNIYAVFLEHNANGYSNTTNSGVTFNSGVLCIIKMDSNCVPQKFYRSLLFPLENWVGSGAQGKLSLGSQPVFDGTDLWIQMNYTYGYGWPNIGSIYDSYKNQGLIMVKINMNNPTTYTDSNGTYILPAIQAAHQSSQGMVNYDFNNQVAGRLCISNYNNDGSTNKKIQYVVNRFRDYGAVYYNTNKLFVIDTEIDSNVAYLLQNRDPSWIDTDINIKLYDTALNTMTTNMSNGLNNSQYTGMTTASGGMSSSTSTGLYVFRKTNGNVNPSQTFVWGSTP